jgi:hypothetical protein
MPATDVLVIGAGPFGLSISAHLRALDVDHVIVGRPMNTYRAHVPAGMLMKSEPYASAIASPGGGYDPAAYSRQHGIDYVDRVGPLTLGQFLDYADWYTKELVPDVRDIKVAEISPAGDRFRISFADAEPLSARKIVVATGVIPYAHIPDELSGLPSSLVSHVSEHSDLTRFHGQRVAVVGAGQSALESAALLHEQGVDVQIIARVPALSWNAPNPEHLGPIGRIKRPVNQLCEGWHCAFWNKPTLFRRLPEPMRVTKARTVLGPNGSWWLKDRVDGVIETLTSYRIKGAMAEGSGVRVLLDGGAHSSVRADHVLAGTGYRIDLARLGFLPDDLRARIATVSGYPAVSRLGLSSVPGLYFVGAPTAVSIGPSARFIAGTHNMARKLARQLSR